MRPKCQTDFGGKNGNFILTNGCQVDEAREENLRAMIASVKEVGV